MSSNLKLDRPDWDRVKAFREAIDKACADYGFAIVSAKLLEASMLEHSTDLDMRFRQLRKKD
jgi:hypothetical protein